MSVAIHNIDIKKPKTNEELSFIQKLFNDKLSPRIKEMANKYRLQQLPKTKFVGGSMKTIKQGKHLRIKYGQLKPECEHLCPDMEGKGLFDFIKSKAKDLYSGLKSGVSKVFSTRLDDYNNTTKETLRKYGDMNIDNLMIYRTPVHSMIDKALNIFSFGKFAEMKKKYGFDEFFHLALVAQVKGKNVIIEKNEVINVSTSYKTNDRTETMKVEMKAPKTLLTINQLLNATREKQTPDDYFSYDAFNNNCQMFIRALLRNVDLYTKDIDVFLFQNVENLIKEMPTLAKVAKTATDVGAWFNKITGQGGGVYIPPMFGQPARYIKDTAGYMMNRQPKITGQGGGVYIPPMFGQPARYIKDTAGYMMNRQPPRPYLKQGGMEGSDEEQKEGQPKKPKKKQQEGQPRNDDLYYPPTPPGGPTLLPYKKSPQKSRKNDGGMIDPPSRREGQPKNPDEERKEEFKQNKEMIRRMTTISLRTLYTYLYDLSVSQKDYLKHNSSIFETPFSSNNKWEETFNKVEVWIEVLRRIILTKMPDIPLPTHKEWIDVSVAELQNKRPKTWKEVYSKLGAMEQVFKNTMEGLREYKTDDEEGKGKPCKYCSIMKGLGDLNRLYTGSGKASGFIRVLMANKDKKGDRRRNRRGQLLPKFDLDADYKASVDVIKTNKKATKHKKYFKDLSVLEDKEQMREKGYNPAESYYDINHEVRDGYDRRGQQNREAGARWRARNREAERERQKKKREERLQRGGGPKLRSSEFIEQKAKERRKKARMAKKSIDPLMERIKREEIEQKESDERKQKIKEEKKKERREKRRGKEPDFVQQLIRDVSAKANG